MNALIFCGTSSSLTIVDQFAGAFPDRERLMPVCHTPKVSIDSSRERFQNRFALGQKDSEPVSA
jgi:hypothetical protein